MSILGFAVGESQKSPLCANYLEGINSKSRDMEAVLASFPSEKRG